jgi:hypothetical protein
VDYHGQGPLDPLGEPHTTPTGIGRCGTRTRTCRRCITRTVISPIWVKAAGNQRAADVRFVPKADQFGSRLTSLLW